MPVACRSVPSNLSPYRSTLLTCRPCYMSPSPLQCSCPLCIVTVAFTCTCAVYLALQEAWRNVHASCLNFTSSPRCPTVIGMLYGKIYAGVCWLGAPPTPPNAAGATGSPASRCSVM